MNNLTQPGRAVVLCKRQFSASRSKSCKKDSAANSKRQSVTSCPGSGSFACRLLWFSPYCRTPSVGGGRSAVSRSRPEPLNPNPGRSVGPGFLARRMRSKRCMFKLVCDSVLDRWKFFFRRFFGSQLAQTQVLSRILGSAGPKMAAKASASKGSEELVGQELARSFWRQGLAEAEAGRKKA